VPGPFLGSVAVAHCLVQAAHALPRGGDGRSMQMSKVLIVDDDAVIVEMMTQILQEEGLTVVTALEPLRVYDAAKRERPDVILLDIMMPYLDGWDELQLLHVDPDTSRTPVVFVTAKHGEFDSLPPERRREFFDYLYKPFEIDDLVAKVRAALESRSARQAAER
jgi:DNA-binding response OmpR family regulator